MKWVIASGFILGTVLSGGYGIHMLRELLRQKKRSTYTSIWHDDKERIL